MTPARGLLFVSLVVLALLAGAAGGCSTAPQTPAQRAAVADESQEMLAVMQARDPQLKAFLARSAGYAVFPNVGKGGFLFGGAFGRGAVYDPNGDLRGYAKVTQASVGGVIGARNYALLLTFEDPSQLYRFCNGSDIRFGAEASAIAIHDGCATATRYHDGVAVFAMPRGGLMADASLNGQSFAFEHREPKDHLHQPDAATTTVQTPTD